MMRKLAKVTYFEAENLEIKSFSTLIGYFCDWLLKITVQKFWKSCIKHRFAIGLAIHLEKDEIDGAFVSLLSQFEFLLMLMVQLIFFSFDFIIRSFQPVNCSERCEKFQTIKSSASSIY